MKWIKVLNSPFKPFKLRFYIGEIKIGIPYFLPIKWIKFSKKERMEAATKAFNKSKVAGLSYTWQYWYDHYKGHRKSIAKTIGFDSCSLGWKTKWSNTDYRYEWPPTFSLVFFKWQFAIIVYTEHPDEYWCAWLYYEHNTDKTKSRKERIEQCKKEFPITYTSHYKDREETIDYYTLILKKKYL